MIDCTEYDKKIDIRNAICLLESKINELCEEVNGQDYATIQEKLKELERLVDFYINGVGIENMVIAATNPIVRPDKPKLGQKYFDITLNKPLWWNGDRWQDGNGLLYFGGDYIESK